MCQRVTILHEISPSRYVSQCEHGTVHLLWDCVGIHISELNFRTLAQNMERTWEEQRRSCQPVTKLWLKVAQIVLQVEAFEFEEILGMVQDTICRMDGQMQGPTWMSIRFGPLDTAGYRISVN